MKKKIIIHILSPIIMAVLSYFFFTRFVFNIPDPKSPGCYTPETYFFGFLFAVFILSVASIISAILYVGNKRKNN